MSTPDTHLSAAARVQHGVFTLQQALAAGFTRPVVLRRVRSGVWQEVDTRVYRAGLAAPVTWIQRQMAAVLVVGGVASHHAAAALHGLVAPPDGPEVTLLRPSRRAIAATVHNTDDLPPMDRCVVDRIPATSVARTLVDLGGCMPRAQFEDVFDTSLVRRMVTVHRVRSRAEALWAPRRKGCALILELLAERGPELARAANVWEAKVLRVVQRLGLPQPSVNHGVVVGGRQRYLDLAWPEVKVAVEFDGFVPHSTRRVFDDDRARQNDLVADGWTIFRVTKAMLTGDLERTFAPIAAAVLGKDRASGTPAFQDAQL